MTDATWDPQLADVRGWYIDGRRVHNPFASDAVLAERFDSWLIEHDAETRSSVLGDRDTLREKIAETVRAIKPDPYGVRKVSAVADAVLDVLYGKGE